MRYLFSLGPAVRLASGCGDSGGVVELVHELAAEKQITAHLDRRNTTNAPLEVEAGLDALPFCGSPVISGHRWLTPDLFRIGASRLANDILMQLTKEASGVYQSLDYFSKD